MLLGRFAIWAACRNRCGGVVAIDQLVALELTRRVCVRALHSVIQSDTHTPSATRSPKQPWRDRNGKGAPHQLEH